MRPININLSETKDIILGKFPEMREDHRYFKAALVFFIGSTGRTVDAEKIKRGHGLDKTEVEYFLCNFLAFGLIKGYAWQLSEEALSDKDLIALHFKMMVETDVIQLVADGTGAGMAKWGEQYFNKSDYL